MSSSHTFKTHPTFPSTFCSLSALFITLALLTQGVVLQSFAGTPSPPSSSRSPSRLATIHEEELPAHAPSNRHHRQTLADAARAEQAFRSLHAVLAAYPLTRTDHFHLVYPATLSHAN